jgi:methyltransferase
MSGRKWTLSVAVPASMLDMYGYPPAKTRSMMLTIYSCSTGDQRSAMVGRVARVMAIFRVDEVVVYDDRPTASRVTDLDATAYTGELDPAHFVAHILSYLEVPPFMRTTLIPIHRNLDRAGKLPSLDIPSHPHKREWCPYREGLALSGRPEAGKGTMVNVGLDSPVTVDAKIPPNTRVTLHFPSGAKGKPEAVDPTEPRTEGGYYWGYTVRRAGSLSAVFTEAPYDDGYDVSIGTSERGIPLSKAFPPAKKVTFSHMLVVFGGPRGIEYATMNDEDLAEKGISARNAKELFDHWVNILPSQGSRTIRTDEAMFMAMQGLSGIWNEK